MKRPERPDRQAFPRADGIEAISLDLDDTLWPVHVLFRLQKRRQHRPQRVVEVERDRVDPVCPRKGLPGGALGPLHGSNTS